MKKLTAGDRADLLATLKTRFEKHPERHKGIKWADVEARIEKFPAKLGPLAEMEGTAGEPDVVGQDKQTGEYLFYDCSPESPKGRVSVCYDREGWGSRKEHRPSGNAVDMAAGMGIDILTEEEYQHLQTLGKFDQKTSTWVKTPAELRKLGGALFGDRRFGRVFIYHNGAQSYYSARGFRGVVKV